MSNPLQEEDLIKLAQVIMAIFDAWKLEPEQRIHLLGLPGDTKPRALVRYRQSTPLPTDPDVLQRAQIFLSIDSALRTTFPHNPAMGGLWMTTPNRRFDNTTPLSVMLREGMEGIHRIHRHLDCTENWF